MLREIVSMCLQCYTVAATLRWHYGHEKGEPSDSSYSKDIYCFLILITRNRKVTRSCECTTLLSCGTNIVT